MSKVEFSLEEKKLIRALLIFAFIQILIILLFMHMLDESQPIDLENTKQLDVTVEEVYYTRVVSEYRFDIYSDSIKYSFAGRGTFEEYSNSKLYEIISIGDQLSIIYYEKNSIFGKANWVVDARTENETYRAFEEYNKGKKGLLIAVIIVFCIVEIIFCGVLIVYILINSNILRAFRKKCLKKRYVK